MMGESTKIEWCDHTFNPWVGCQKVSPACDHCYAEGWAKRSGLVGWGPHADRRRTSAATWSQPAKWNAAAAKAGRIDRVFCLSLGDIWDAAVEPAWRSDLFDLIERTPSLLWLLLSKRIGNAVRMCGGRGLPRNTALGATMINQDEYDRDAPKLAEARRVLQPRFTFASVEPMLGPLDVSHNTPDWIICGGESGPGARPTHPAWVRSIRDQCTAAGVAFFFKQWGEWLPGEANDGQFGPRPLNAYRRCDNHSFDWPPHRQVQNFQTHPDPHSGKLTARRLGKARAGRLLDGRTWDEIPEITHA